LTRSDLTSLVVLGALLAGACAPGGARVVDIARADVHVTVRDDGAVDVVETFHVRARAPASDPRFERVVSADRVDDFGDVAATLDGRPVPAAPPVPSLFRSQDLTVVWTLPPQSSAEHVLELRYRATGALSVVGGRSSLRWAALPFPRSQSIGSARLTLVVDPAVVLAEVPGVESAGWIAAWRPPGIVAEKAPVPADDAGVLLAELSVGPNARVPRWQYDEDRTGQLAPAFVSGALFVLVVGAGVLWMIRFYLRDERGPAEVARAATARALRIAGWIIVAFGAVCVCVAAFGIRRYGWWPMTMAASVIVVGVAFVHPPSRFRAPAR
jgi:hypothetical protein